MAKAAQEAHRQICLWLYESQQQEEQMKTAVPTCIKSIAVVQLLLGLAALVPGLGGVAALGRGQQRGNGPPQRFGLDLGSRVVLILNVHQLLPLIGVL